MIASLRGTLTLISGNTVVVDVHGVGFDQVVEGVLAVKPFACGERDVYPVTNIFHLGDVLV